VNDLYEPRLVLDPESNVIQIIHRNVDLKCFFSCTKTFVCYYRYTCIFHSYFTR